MASLVSNVTCFGATDLLVEITGELQVIKSTGAGDVDGGLPSHSSRILLLDIMELLLIHYLGLSHNIFYSVDHEII